MTTGSKTGGFQTPVVTGSGPSTLYEGYWTKSWSGTDYPPSPIGQRPEQGGYGGSRNRYTQAWFGGAKAPLFLGDPLFPLPRHSPPRADVVEHPYSMNYEFTNGSIYAVSANPLGPWTTRTPQQDGGTFNLVSWGWSANDDIALLGKLRNGVAGSDFNAGVFLGEGVKALEMIFGAGNKIYRAYNAGRKLDFIGAASELFTDSRHRPPKRKVVANNWLELQYGWLPLVNDVYEGAVFLSHHLNVPLKKVIKVRRKVGGQSVQLGNAVVWNTPDNWKIREAKQIKAIIEEKDVYQMAGLMDPLPILWELLPYSFIVDWFIPIGNYLHGRGLASSLKGTFVTSHYQYFDSGAMDKLKPGFFMQPGTINQFHSRKVNVSRTVSTTLSVPTPGFKPLSSVPGWRRAANAVALVTQMHR
jgi:hypothetical protein